MRLLARARPPPQAAEKARQQQKAAPDGDEADGGRENAFLGHRHGRLEIAVDRFHHIPVAVAHHQGDAREGAGLHHGLAMGLEPSQALHIGLHGGALAADEIVRVGAQARDGAVPGLAARAGIAIEARDHLAQLVDRAAEALAVLLREFGALRGDDAAAQPAAESDDANDPGQA